MVLRNHNRDRTKGAQAVTENTEHGVERRSCSNCVCWYVVYLVGVRCSKMACLWGSARSFKDVQTLFFFHTLSKVTFFTCSTCASYIITVQILRYAPFLSTQSKVDISSNAKCQHETHSHRELAHASRTTLVYFVRCVCVVVNTVHCTLYTKHDCPENVFGVPSRSILFS